jgi:hypothetical protein
MSPYTALCMQPQLQQSLVKFRHCGTINLLRDLLKQCLELNSCQWFRIYCSERFIIVPTFLQFLDSALKCEELLKNHRNKDRYVHDPFSTSEHG